MKLLSTVKNFLTNKQGPPKHTYQLWHGSIFDKGIQHSRPDYFGPSAQWANSDTEENYREKMEGKGLTDYGPDSFIYTQNPQGYRCDDLNLLKIRAANEIRIVFNGCSVTYGVGVPVEDIWCYQLLERLRGDFPNYKFPYINIAKGGRSLDYIVRTYYLFAESVKYDMAIPLIPVPSRFELVVMDNIVTDFLKPFVPTCTTELEQQADAVFREHFAKNELYVQYHLQKNFAFLRTLMKAHGIRLLWSSWAGQDDLHDWLPPELQDGYLKHMFDHFPEHGKWGRDGVHPDRITHKKFADLVYDQVRDEVQQLIQRRRDAQRYKATV